MRIVNEHKNILSIDNVNCESIFNRLKKDIELLPIQEIKNYAFTLKRLEVNVLVEFFDEIYDLASGRKAFQIIKYRIRRENILSLWRMFQDLFEDTKFTNYFSEILNNKDASSSIGIGQNDLNTIKAWIESGKTMTSATYDYRKIKYHRKTFIKKYNINQNQKLMKAIDKEIYRIADKDFFVTKGAYRITQETSEFTDKDFGFFSNNYLGKLKVKEFQDPVLKLMEKKLGDIHSLNSSFIWETISEPNRIKYKKWLISHTLDIFFEDQDRLIFWKKYIDSISDVYHVKKFQQLFMDFGYFVAIEFGQVGNAVYFYPKKYFKQNFSKYTNEFSAVRNEYLKNRAYGFKINHIGAWQYRTHNIVKDMIKNGYKNF